jgi:hypothetical protein
MHRYPLAPDIDGLKNRMQKTGWHLLVKKGDAACNTLFTCKLSQIAIFGNVEITHRGIASIDTVLIFI